MSAAEEKRALFNEQMNQWVSRQGLWFQLRHAADGQTLISRILGILMRCVVFLVIAAIGFLIYLIKRVDSDGFRENIRVAVEDTFKSQECKVGVFRRDRQVANLGYVKMKGGDASFFHDLEARGIRMNMKLTDGLFGSWDGQSLIMHQLDAVIKSGGSDDADAATSFAALFVEQEEFEFERIECKDTTISWGYSEYHRGSIKGSYLTAGREGNGWRLEFKGGTFSQNWFRNLAIKKMVIHCHPQGFSIQEAELVAGDGRITFRASMGSGSQPSVKGTIQMESIPMESLLSQSFAKWIQGTISGKGLISGSINSQEGILLDLDLGFQNDDVTFVRDHIAILSSLTVIDNYNSYRKIPFNEGTFNIRTGGNQLKISEFNVKSGDLLHLKGNVDVRPPTDAEIAEALEVSDVKKVTKILKNNWLDTERKNQDLAANSALSKVNQNTTGDVIKTALKSSVLAQLAIMRFDGKLQLGLAGDVFDKSPKLRAAYPIDPMTSRIWLDVPMEGRLQTLTLKQAEELYTLGRKAASD